MILPDQFTLVAGPAVVEMRRDDSVGGFHPSGRLLPFAEPEAAIDGAWLLTDRDGGGSVVDGVGHFDFRAIPAAFVVDDGKGWFSVPEPAAGLIAPLAALMGGRRRRR